MCGWIKLHSQIIDWEWYDDINTCRLFIHLLLTVNWRDGRWHGLEVKAGQRVTSLAALSDETGLTVKQIRLALDKLSSTGEVGRERAKSCTLITVENYTKYQVREESKGNEMATKGQQKGNKRATIEDYKTNRQREKDSINTIPKEKVADVFAREPLEVQDTLQDFADFRKEIKKPLTPTAAKLLVVRCHKFIGLDDEPPTPEQLETYREILQNSIAHGWTGVYEIDKKHTTKSQAEQYYELMRELE